MSLLDILRSLSAEEVLTGDQVFDSIFEASEVVTSIGLDSTDAIEIAVRLLDASEKGQVPPGCHDAIAHLAEECGLYPYIVGENTSVFRRIGVEANAIHLGNKYYLHAKQIEVLSQLVQGRHVVLSAPTSFGKSLLVDAFISIKRPQTAVLIVPTIALIDEFRRRMYRNFPGEYQILTHRGDTRDQKRPAIYVLTQERFLGRDDITEIDFFFVDEFYKLDPDRGDTRYQTLNVALDRGARMAKQFFLAGPNITSVNVGDDWAGRLTFFKTNYQTVTVNTVDRSRAASRLEAFITDLSSVKGKQSLVYTKSPPSARRLMVEVLGQGIFEKTEDGRRLGDWVRENYHPDWYLASACEAGVGAHHGKLPRALAQFFVELFNKGELQLLICTSTLIEGVNTSAECVFIYDKEINVSNFDFFSFSNIRGRVGRMMRHFVGTVFLYYEPPEEVDTDVDVPIFSGPDDASEYILMNVNPDALSDRGREEQMRLPFETGFSAQFLKNFGHYGTEALMRTRDRVGRMMEVNGGRFVWGGRPDYNQMVTLVNAMRELLAVKSDRVSRMSDKQIAWAWQKLAGPSDLPQFIDWFVRTFAETDHQEGIERTFEFLAACEYSFPTAVSAIDAMIGELYADLVHDYSFFAVELENWFRPSWMKALDEIGLPLPLAERLAPFLGRPNSYDEALDRLSRLSPSVLNALGSIDRKMIERSVGPGSLEQI